jgi:hypothetical protein
MATHDYKKKEEKEEEGEEEDSKGRWRGNKAVDCFLVVAKISSTNAYCNRRGMNHFDDRMNG